MREIVRTDIIQDRFIVTIKGLEIPAKIGEEVQDEQGNRFILVGFDMGYHEDASLLLKPLNGKKEIGKYLLEMPDCGCE